MTVFTTLILIRKICLKHTLTRVFQTWERGGWPPCTPTQGVLVDFLTRGVGVFPYERHLMSHATVGVVSDGWLLGMACAQFSSNLFSSKVFRPIHFVQSY